MPPSTYSTPSGSQRPSMAARRDWASGSFHTATYRSVIVRATVSVVSVMALLPSFGYLLTSDDAGPSHYRRVKPAGRSAVAVHERGSYVRGPLDVRGLDAHEVVLTPRS